MSDNPEDHELLHYGVLGMKWGRRKDKGNSAVSSTSKADQSDDSKAAENAKAKVAKSGISSLSNKELQNLNERMNLEANYKRLTSNGTPENSKLETGKKAYKTLIDTSRIANEVYKHYESPAVRLLRQQLKKNQQRKYNS